MPQAKYRIPSEGDTVLLDADPRKVGLKDVAQYGDRLKVIRTTIDDGGFFVTVRPLGSETTYQLAADHVAPPGDSF